jgi:DeoR family suf operon transcriptional repressor
MYKNSSPRERVLDRLLEGPATIDELAHWAGVVPVTMRGHVKALAEQGLVAGENERGRVGRPRQRFRLTDKARGLLPNRCAGLTAELLEGLQALAGSRGVEQLLDLAAARYAGKPLEGSLRERVQAAAGVLDQESGRACAEEEDDRFLIRDYHCPYGKVTAICRYHTQVVTRLVAAPVTLERSLARGDEHCVFAVQHVPLRTAAGVRTLSDGRVAPERRGIVVQ